MIIPVRIGYNTQNKACGTVENVPCPHCHRTAQFIKLKNETVNTVAYIPVAKATNTAFLYCSACTAAFEVYKNDLNTIVTDNDAIRAISRHYHDKQSGTMQANLKREQKNLRTISLIMLIISAVLMLATMVSGAHGVAFLFGLCTVVSGVLFARSFLHVKYQGLK